MQSTSVSENGYIGAVRAFLTDVSSHPEMFARSASELELILFGHAVGWSQHSGLMRSSFIDRGFSDWVRDEFGKSTSLGWGEALDRMSDEDSIQAVSFACELLFRYIETLPTTSTKS